MNEQALVTLAVGLIATLGGIAGQYGAFKYFSGRVDQRFTADEQRLDKLEVEQKDQWGVINTNKADIAAQSARCQAIHGTDRPNGRMHY